MISNSKKNVNLLVKSETTDSYYIQPLKYYKKIVLFFSFLDQSGQISEVLYGTDANLCVVRYFDPKRLEKTFHKTYPIDLV